MNRLTTPLRLAACLTGALLSTSCDEPTEGTSAVAPLCVTGSCETHTLVATTLSFALPVTSDGNVVEGFDLDGYRSTGDVAVDGSGCGLRDKISPTGVIGIDNNLAGLFAFIVKLTGDAVFGLIQTAINQGTILLIIRLEGVDDLVNDDNVRVVIMKGQDSVDLPPQLGTNGLIAPDQTFMVDSTITPVVGAGRIVDGHLEAGPFETVMLPVRFFQVAANFRVHNAVFRGDFQEDGSLVHGLLGGGVEVEQILEIAEIAGSMDHNAAQIAGVAPAIVAPLADLDYDGQETCRQLSTAMKFTAQPAHLFGDAP